MIWCKGGKFQRYHEYYKTFRTSFYSYRVMHISGLWLWGTISLPALKEYIPVFIERAGEVEPIQRLKERVCEVEPIQRLSLRIFRVDSRKRKRILWSKKKRTSWGFLDLANIVLLSALNVVGNKELGVLSAHDQIWAVRLVCLQLVVLTSETKKQMIVIFDHASLDT